MHAAVMQKFVQQKKFNLAIKYFAARLGTELDRDKIFTMRARHKTVRHAAYYYAAWLQIAENCNALALNYLTQIPAATSADVGLCDYSTFSASTSMLYTKLKRQIEKPVVLIAAMPKSASSYVSSIVSTMMDIPVVRVSFGQFPKLAAVPRWLKTMGKFGGVTHDHLLPEPWTQECIISAGIADIFVQYRDPRAAAWSACMQHPELPQIERFTSHLKWFNGWLHDWLKIQDAKPSFKIHFISYDEVRNEPAHVFRKIFEISGYETNPDMLDATLAKASKEMHLYNFRSGDPDEWQRMLPPEHVVMSKELLSPRVKCFLGIERKVILNICIPGGA